MPLTNPYRATIQVERADFRRQIEELKTRPPVIRQVKLSEKLCIISQAIEFYIGPPDEYETAYLADIAGEFRQAVEAIDSIDLKAVAAEPDGAQAVEQVVGFRKYIAERADHLTAEAKKEQATVQRLVR